jgi:spermidine synthase
VLSHQISRGEIVFELTSPYHHVQVVEEGGIRMLSFDGSRETRMSISNPLEGHFEYTEYFHMPWLWNPHMTNVLVIGLGGGSTQRSYEHYYPQVTVETAEIDPVVVKVAKDYFHFKESDRQKVHMLDGRLHLRRTRTTYDAMLLDAYVANRYGSFIPYPLATKEFFELANERLSTNGVIAYNVIGRMQGWRADVLGSVYKTMKEVFPHVYLFPAGETLNVVLIGVKSEEPLSVSELQQRASTLMLSKQVTLPRFRDRLMHIRSLPPPNFDKCQVLTDDFAPVDGLLSQGR